MPDLTDPRLQARFWTKVDLSGECWLWTASLSGSGYGRFYAGAVTSTRGRPMMSQAHRVSYEMHVGPIPDGLEIDHLCRVRQCVNPAHLEPVTTVENLRRAEDSATSLNRAKVACPKGHPYDKTDHRGKRVCTQCLREYNIAYQREYHIRKPRRKTPRTAAQ